MAEVTQTRVLPAEFIEAGGKTFLEMLTGAVGKYGTADLSKIFGPQFVAGQDPLQAQAQQLATQGIGAYKPFLQAAAASTGPGAYKQFMSPYQQDVIDTTMADFDVQAAKGAQGVPAAAIAAGAFGGGREGIASAELERARLATIGQSQAQGFQTALAAAQQQQGTQLQAGQLLGALGQTQQAMGLQDIQSQLQAGAIQRGIGQAGLEAQRQTALQRAYEPFQRIEFLKGIMTNLPTTQSSITATTAPGSNPLSQSLGAGLGAYSAYQFTRPRG